MPLTSIITPALASSLSILDLSSNTLSGALPSTLSTYTSLLELHVDNNNLTSLPDTLPPNLKALTLSGNAQLSGAVPASACGNANLRTCDLRGTGLNNSSCGSCIFGQLQLQ